MIMPEDFSVDSMPAWHNALFLDDHGSGYFSPSLFAGEFQGSHRFSIMTLCSMVSFCHLSFALYMSVRRGALIIYAHQRRCPKPFYTVNQHVVSVV